MITKREAAIIMAYTGFSIGEFSEFHGYVEEIMGRPVFTHEFGDTITAKEIHEKSKADFIKLSDSII